MIEFELPKINVSIEMDGDEYVFIINGAEKRIKTEDMITQMEELAKPKSRDYIEIPNGATRREIHKLVFGIDVPELYSDKFRCAREKGCSNCRHKDSLNCDMNWWEAPYIKSHTFDVDKAISALEQTDSWKEEYFFNYKKGAEE